MDDEEYEKEFKSCNGMSAVRKVAEKHEEVVEVAPLAEGCAEADDALHTKNSNMSRKRMMICWRCYSMMMTAS